MNKTHRFHVALPERQWRSLNLVSDKTQLTVSEIVRAMVERAMSRDQLDAMFPSLSGQFLAGGTK
jgi:macrodomain Ter protein organizer (MatP/YcbG family)